jgi:hypothetical protein
MKTALNDTGQAPGRLPLGLNPIPAPDFTAINRAKMAAWMHRRFKRPAHWENPHYFRDLFRRYAMPLLVHGGRA